MRHIREALSYQLYTILKHVFNALWLEDSPNVLRDAGVTTPYNIGSVLWRLFSTLEVVQYIGRITSVLWGVASVLWRLFSTVAR